MSDCMCCGALLSLVELLASHAPAYGIHDRSGRLLCDVCWADFCRHLAGPEDVVGPSGLAGELHVHETREVFDWLETAPVVRRQPLTFTILGWSVKP